MLTTYLLNLCHLTIGKYINLFVYAPIFNHITRNTVHHPGNHRLALAHRDQVGEGRQGLGIQEERGAPQDDEGIAGSAVRGPQRDSREAEDLEDVEVVVLEGDRRCGALAQRPFESQREGSWEADLEVTEDWSVPVAAFVAWLAREGRDPNET